MKETNYSKTVPQELVETLHKCGYFTEYDYPAPTFGEVIDWLSENGLTLIISHPWDSSMLDWSTRWTWTILYSEGRSLGARSYQIPSASWAAAATVAITEALAVKLCVRASSRR